MIVFVVVAIVTVIVVAAGAAAAAAYLPPDYVSAVRVPFFVFSLVIVFLLCIAVSYGCCWCVVLENQNRRSFSWVICCSESE